MNRPQFLVATIFSGVVALSLLAQLVLFKSMQSQQYKVAETQQVLQQGQLTHGVDQVAGPVALEQLGTNRDAAGIGAGQLVHAHARRVSEASDHGNADEP